MISWSQISGALQPALIIACTWLAAKGYIANTDVGNYVAFGLGICAMIWGGYQNSPSVIKEKAKALDG